ncbi:hypothetical protein BBJ28_00013343 [Nothophytophthora sp. Chile5]|nr:hypothetical protein BBJ28_00013343 [Nothophytophthora sp. Chile5]
MYFGTSVLQATPVKVVGSRAVCCEGQLVDGLLVVREGELSELSPCGLPVPPDLSVSFALSGALAVTQHQEDRAQSGRAFFAQLEAAGSPLAFQKVNEVFHGFLPQDFVSRKLRELRCLEVKTHDHGSRANMQTDPPRRRVSSQPLAKALRRGDCFCASSSWIPLRQSRLENQDGARGVACAKTALVSAATTDLMFFSAADLTQALSMPSRARLHRNLQVIAAADVTSAPQNTRRFARTKGTLASHLLLSLPGRRSNNLLEQTQRDEHWSKFKQELVQSVLRGRT